jgi:ribosomal protein S3AE
MTSPTYNSHHIIIKWIPKEKRGSYTPKQVNRQFVEAFLHKHKLTYVRNMDLSTLDNRVIRVVQMTLAPRKFVFSQMPKIIVEINLDKEECN